MSKPYTAQELRQIAHSITAFVKGGTKEIAYLNPFTEELTVYDVPLRDQDVKRLRQQSHEFMNPEL